MLEISIPQLFTPNLSVGVMCPQYLIKVNKIQNQTRRHRKENPMEKCTYQESMS